jgi:hypothetical protein
MNTLRCFNKKMLVAATASVVLGLGMAGNASAAPFSYAASFNEVKNWSVTDASGNQVNFLNPVYISDAHAELNGTLSSDDDINPPPHFPVDAPIQTLGSPAQMNNAFTQLGHTGQYAWGDAVIWAPDHAQNAGEIYLSSRGVGGGGGMNTLSASFVTPGQLTFAFDAAPYLQAYTTGATVNDWARADLDFNITIYDALGNVVFEWDPNGAPGGIIGGTEIFDPISLNRDVFANAIIQGPLLHNSPLGTFGSFKADTTGLIAGGTYNMSVSMGEHAHASVPEPGTMFLLGGGLAGLAFAARRRAAAKA